jgi:hypothetical protein
MRKFDSGHAIHKTIIIVAASLALAAATATIATDAFARGGGGHFGGGFGNHFGRGFGFGGAGFAGRHLGRRFGGVSGFTDMAAARLIITAVMATAMPSRPMAAIGPVTETD